MKPETKALILGMGNPILSDDGIGLRTARELRPRMPGVDTAEMAFVGLNTLDVLTGYDKVFVIDAIFGEEVGAVRTLTPEQGTPHLFSSHGVAFWELLELGKRLGYGVPEDVVAYGVEIDRNVAFSEELTVELESKLESITAQIAEDITRRLATDSPAGGS